MLSVMTPIVDPRTFALAAEQLAHLGRWIHHQGWSPAASENVSLHLEAVACMLACKLAARSLRCP
jgi:hypothetical protein